MTPEQLKASILQYAIQGKLVEQRPEEGTGEELYWRIQAEKQRMIEKGKLKKEKPLSEIAGEEVPFGIPGSWKWVRLGQCGIFVRGSGIKKDEVAPTGLPCVRYGQLYTHYKTKFSSAVSFISEELFQKCQKICPSDILMALTGENNFDIALAVTYEGTEPVAMGGDMTKFTGYNIDPLYFTYVINSPYGIACKSKLATGNIIVHISNDKLASIPIPLPPLAEQKRIVTKIEELLPYVDRYASAYEKLERLNAKFPQDMKKSILQYAIQGKLVEQRPEEGTGEELYRRIQAEKQALIKIGIFKKDKPLLDIVDEEIPFDIPDSWKWVRLDDVVQKPIKRGKSPTYTQQSNTLVFAQKCNTKAGYINLDIALFLDEQKLDKYPNEEFMQDYDIVINSTGNGTLGRVGMYRNADNPKQLSIVPDSHVTVIRTLQTICVEYVYYVLKHYQPYMEKLGTGSTNQTELSANTIRALLLPIPPLAEQKRIVAKLEEVLPLCGRLG